MNLFANVVSQKCRQRTFGIILFLALSSLVPALVGQPVTSSNRFLFIIDISAGMKPFEKPLRDSVFDLIYSGARGRMQNGDTYGIWLINDKNNTSFQMETWKSKHIVELAAQAASHANTNGFKGKARLDLALSDVLRVIKKIDDLIVIVVSNGETPLSGTPFDEELNARISALAPQMKAAKATFNTALVAQDGNFVAWAVNSPDFLIDVPNVPRKPKPLKPAFVAAKTNEPASEAKVVAATTISKAPVVKPRVASSSIIITKDSVAKEKLSYLSSTTDLADPSPVVAATNSTPTDVAAPQNLATVVVTNRTNGLAAKAAVENPIKPVATASAVPGPAVLTREEANAVTLIPNLDGAQTLSMEQSGLGGPLRWAAMGAGAMLFCVVLLRVISSRNRQEPSLISQAFARERSLH